MDQTRILTIISEFRKSILHLAIALVAGTAALYFLSPFILHHLQDHLNQQLSFFRVAEPFIAHIKLAFLTAVFLLFLSAIWSPCRSGSNSCWVTSRSNCGRSSPSAAS
ncbi:MAG: hypothetical protein P8Y63_02900 [Deltaproteobacteria bacterium]